MQGLDFSRLAPVGADTSTAVPKDKGPDRERSYWELTYERLMNPWQFVDPVVGLVAGWWGSPIRLPGTTPMAERVANSGSPFGARRSGKGDHMGQDLAVPAGTIVLSSTPGVVIKADRDSSGDGGLGVMVENEVAWHTDPLLTGRYRHEFWHLSQADVKRGDQVLTGTRLGLSGATGRVTGPHLHWETNITFPNSPIVWPWDPMKGFTVNAWPFINQHFIRLMEMNPGNMQCRNAWAFWLTSGNHDWAFTYLNALGVGHGTITEEVKAKLAELQVRAVAEWNATITQVTAPFEQAATDVSAAGKKVADLPWGWIIGGTLGVAATAAITYHYLGKR